MRKLAGLVMVISIFMLTACSASAKVSTSPSPTVSVVPTSSPSPSSTEGTITTDGYYVTLPLPVAGSDHPNTVDLSVYSVIKAGKWKVPGKGCAVTIFDAKGYASAQQNNPVKVVIGPTKLTLPSSALIYTHECLGMALEK